MSARADRWRRRRVEAAALDKEAKEATALVVAYRNTIRLLQEKSAELSGAALILQDYLRTAEKRAAEVSAARLLRAKAGRG